MEAEQLTSKSLRRIIILILSFALGLYLGGMLIFKSSDAPPPTDAQSSGLKDTVQDDR